MRAGGERCRPVPNHSHIFAVIGRLSVEACWEVLMWSGAVSHTQHVKLSRTSNRRSGQGCCPAGGGVLMGPSATSPAHTPRRAEQLSPELPHA